MNTGLFLTCIVTMLSNKLKKKNIFLAKRKCKYGKIKTVKIQTASDRNMVFAIAHSGIHCLLQALVT
jgi:hypothetical protein